MVKEKMVKGAGIILGGQKPKKRITEGKKNRMEKILVDMQSKLERIEKQRVAAVKAKPREISPEEARKMIEEIKVPSLKAVREKGKR